MTAQQRREALLHALPRTGIRISELNKAPGLRMHICTFRGFVSDLEKAGLVATCRAKVGTASHERWVFADVVARDLFAARHAQEVAERRKLATQARDKLRAEQRKEERAKLARTEAYAAERAERQRIGEAIRAAKREAARQARDTARQAAKEAKERAAARLREETRAAGLLAKLKGTATPTAKKQSGPAHLPGDPIIPVGLEIQRSAPMRDRFAPGDDFQPLFSAHRPGVWVLPATTCAARAA